MPKIQGALLLAVAAWHAMPSQAEEAGARQDVSLHGFGTLGAVYHERADTEYRRDISQSASGAKGGQVSFAQDSMLAVQADYRKERNVSASIQAVSRLNADNNFDPQVSMAYIKYQTGGYQARLGRLIVEAYLEGDAAEVGYANLMVRQPVVYYPRSMDGVDAEMAYPFWAGLLRFKGAAGWATGKLVSGGPPYDTGGSELLGLEVEYASGGLTGRMSAGRMILKKQASQFLPGTIMASILPTLPNGDKIFDMFTLQGRKVSNWTLALGYDGDGWQGQTGYTTHFSSAWPRQHIAYLRGGYRLEAFTPYVSYLKQCSLRNFTGTGIPDGLSAQTDALNQAIATAEAALFLNQSDLALGVRYDFMRNRALKLQWDHIRYQDSENLIDTTAASFPATRRGYKTLNLFSIALDFVF